MTIKSLLIGSAAAIVAASSAQAADAIVAADPEPVEYVQVCDTYGDGYFYIPGTETCLKFSGYVQWQSIIDDDADDAEHGVEARLQIDAKNDSEIGTIASTIRLTNASAHADGATAFNVDRAFMTAGDGNYWTLGLIGSPWDFDIVGEQSFIDGGVTRLALGYTMAFDGGSLSLYAIDDQAADSTPDFLGKVAFTAGDVSVTAALVYDEDLAAGEIGGKVNLSYMGFGAHAQYSENASTGDYNTGYEWVIGAGYGFDASDKLNIALAADYAMDQFATTNDDYAVSANFTYQVAEGLTAAARFIHANGDSYATADNSLRIRVKRSF